MRRIGLGILLAMAVSVMSGIVRAAEPGARWNYTGDTGPAMWGTLKAEYAACGNGTRQSPIDILPASVIRARLPKLAFHYDVGHVTYLDHDDQLTVDHGAGNFVMVGNDKFSLIDVHVHTPGEHRVDGKSYAMEIHFVHQDAAGHMLAVGVFVERGKADRGVIVAPAADKPEVVDLHISELLPDRKEYWTYNGSLTTPGCGEGLRWIVMQRPIQMSADQLKVFAASVEAVWHGSNARPVQPLNGRFVLTPGL